ncbi:MAG: hypothetical protein EP344_17290 [Bacteroidetes bacterium]|nr:MAG: hypothetical protein EP344_17290 [Bacteroidota bacterium]
MSETKQQLAALTEMRALMERSSRFLSLSGLSGVWAGLCALTGAAVVYLYLGMRPLSSAPISYYEQAVRTLRWGMSYKTFFLVTALAVLVLALAGGLFFTNRKARRQGHKTWDASSRRMLIAMAVPLFTGGIFSLALLHWDLPALVAPATLVFYGLALVNASKFTLHDVEYLGLSEIALGLAGMFFLGFGLELWAAGFGILHIAYGSWMYMKYER